MNFDYNQFLSDKIYALKGEYGLDAIDFVVDQEQAFMKHKDLEPNTVYVLTRMLQNDISIGIDTQPVQVLILSEQNSLESVMSFFSVFAKKYNFFTTTSTYEEDGETHSVWTKQQYTDPVVLSNFNTVDYGYRSVLYMSVNLYIMKDVVDLRDLEIDGTEYKVLSFDMAYSMSPNTQQRSSEYISSSAKTVSTLSISITIPPIQCDLITKVLSIMNESDSTPSDAEDPTTVGGNENFDFDFVFGAHFEHKKLKLISADFGATINNVPAIRLGFMK